MTHLKNDFEKFLLHDDTNIPATLERQILSKAQAELNEQRQYIYSKIGFTH